MSESDDQIDPLEEAVINGTIIPPQSQGLRGVGELMTIRGGPKALRFITGKTFSIPKLAARVIPFIILCLVFFILGKVLPDFIPFKDLILSDPIITPGVAFALSIPFYGIVMSSTGFGSFIGQLSKYRYQQKAVLMSRMPETLFGRQVHDRVQLVPLLSCHPSPTGGRSGDELEVVPCVVTRGLKPLDKVLYEDDPVTNDLIVDPKACADFAAHPPMVLEFRGDEGIPVVQDHRDSLDVLRESREVYAMEFMHKHNASRGIAVRSPDTTEDDLIAEAIEQKIGRKEVK